MSPPYELELPDPQAVETLREALGLHPVTARCLVTRGVEDPSSARAFLDPKLSGLRPPVGLAGLEEALPRLVQAVQSGETVGVFGDYDADGVTTAALLTDALTTFGAQVVSRVASRHRGYGFGVEDAEALVEAGATLLITGDCGTSDLDAIAVANEQGVEVIIIDHHTVPDADQVHPSLALINPFRPESSFPFQGMASVGLAFYVMVALRTELKKGGHFEGKRREPNPCDWLDLVALGTVADLVPLHDENRIMTTEGLRRLAARKRPGVAALMDVAGIKRSDKIDERTVGWKLGPRLNAPGRLGDAKPALDLLLAPDSYTAKAMAQVIEAVNNERRSAQEKVFAEAIEALGEEDPGPCVVISGEGWPHGVVGIIAARLVDRYQRPAFVIGIDGDTGEGRGSARSYGGINLYDALECASGELIRFGGHAAAAGFSLEAERVDAVRDILHQAVIDQEVEAAARISADAEVAAHEVDERLAEELGGLAPFGKGNEEPVLVSRGVTVVETRLVGDGTHLKLTLQAGSREVHAIAFGMGEKDPGAGATVDLAYVPAISTWMGRRRLEFSVREIWTSAS